jgi:hypothetical protein
LGKYWLKRGIGMKWLELDFDRYTSIGGSASGRVAVVEKRKGGIAIATAGNTAVVGLAAAAAVAGM